jgi:hypothetical protein
LGKDLINLNPFYNPVDLAENTVLDVELAVHLMLNLSELAVHLMLNLSELAVHLMLNLSELAVHLR